MMLLPNTQTAVNTDAFTTSYSGGFSVGNTPLLTTKLCFIPQKAPAEAKASIAVAPWRGPLFRAEYVLEISAPPKVLATKIIAPIAITKPATYAIDQTDAVFTYELSNAEKTSNCSVLNTTIACDLKELALQQGAEHDVTLTRSFKGQSTEKLVTNTLTILPAITVTSSSPQPTQVVYDKPTSLRFVTDKKLTTALATLEQVDGETKTPIATSLVIDDTTVTLTMAAELAREKQFVLTLTSAEAEDGSTIDEPHSVTFTTSGGPKVTGVSARTSGIDQNARIVVTFDQALEGSVDIAKFAQLVGAGATISKQGAQVIFSLKNAARCAALTLRIDKGITSGTNGLTSKDSWSFTTRTNCKATVVIGYSVKGRPIVAYYYGSGATTILFTGGIHGSEPSSTSTMQTWASHLDTYAYKIPANKQVVIVPNVNPDGIAAGSRYNANGVNLARNFAASDWATDIETTTGILAGGGGLAPVSEPETRALANLTTQLNPRLEVSFHAQGRLVGANDFADSHAIGSVYASLTGYSTMFGSSAEDIMGYGFSGQYEIWIGERLGKPALLIELAGTRGDYFSSQQNALWHMVNL